MVSEPILRNEKKKEFRCIFHPLPDKCKKHLFRKSGLMTGSATCPSILEPLRQILLWMEGGGVGVEVEVSVWFF